MDDISQNKETALIVAVPETAGSTLYGMIDVLSSAGSLWNELVGAPPRDGLIKTKIVSTTTEMFNLANGIPVKPDLAMADNPSGPIVILPEIWLAPDQDLRGRYPEIMAWVNERYRNGAWIYSACSGAVMLAETGLLDGREATSHWGYRHLFRKSYPAVRFQPEPNLCFAVPDGRIVTAGGTSSWHDLVIHIISRHCGPGEALRIAKVYMLKIHTEGQLPFAHLVNETPHADSVVRACETWLKDNYREAEPVARVVEHAGIPERSIKRRFKRATGETLIDRAQNLRIEEAKRLLEAGDQSFEHIAFNVGYENPGFFRSLFKRRTGLTPSQYRKMFQPLAA
jgi:transcriptional regulator GlxA family with amidase domain